MRMEKIQKALTKKNIEFIYTQEDGLGSFDFQFRGLRYHIWEFQEGDSYGAETNVRCAGKSEDVLDNYVQIIADEILAWPDMAIPG
ncbi:MAG: kinase [Lachnospiraceae bacterium]|nr:kinase [Lachnospiraceae bacterium]